MPDKSSDDSTGLHPDRDKTESSVRLLKIPRAAPAIKEYGFRLTRSKWDPYPWVTYSGPTLRTSIYLCMFLLSRLVKWPRAHLPRYVASRPVTAF